MSVSHQGVLEGSEDLVPFLSALLANERARRETRSSKKALTTYRQAVLVLRWLVDDTRMSRLARDNKISDSTAYAYRDEAIRC